MQPENLNFGDLIHSRKPFVIPLYQRAYEWDKKNIDNFIEDINTLVSKRTQGNADQHFFGGIVSVDDFSPYIGNQFLVIDGQQRLATFSMVLALIVKELKEISRTREKQIKESALAHADSIIADYLEYQFVNSEGKQQHQSRVVLSKVDRPFFDSLLQNLQPPTPTRDSHNLLKRAWNNLRRNLIIPCSDKEMPPDTRIQKLLHLKRVITDGCYMIHIVSSNRSEAYRLFMTLNDRGKSLSEGDLLKSRTLELLEEYPDIQESVETHWNTILTESAKMIDAFLRAYFPSQTGKRAGRLTLYADFCEAFFSFDGNVSQAGSKQIDHEIDKMKHESITFNKVDKGDWPYEDPTTSMWYRNRLSRLSNSKILKHTLCYPLLLAARHCLPENRFAEIVQILELFIFRYVIICKAHAGKLAETYYKHCVKIREQAENYSVKDLRDDLKELIDEDAPDSLFQNSLTERLTYPASTSLRIRHFLSTLEDYRSWYDNGRRGRPRPTISSVFDIASFQVEHIYPQSAKAGNINEELELLKHDLGNLSFWGERDNKAASNADFSEKKAIYANSSVSLNRDLANLDTWNRKELEKRRKQLVDMAVKIFTI